MKKDFGVGLLGFGTVGAGVVSVLQQHGDLIAKRIGLELKLVGIADLDLESDRGVVVDKNILTTDAFALIKNPEVDIVIELIGGVTIARKLVLEALKQGKPVVTANKALLAEHGEEIFAVAAENNTDLFYEASVGGGIPVIRSLREGLLANHIHSIYGILNGTCNYILTEMEQRGLPFDSIIKEAQELGYAEAEPSLDIDGVDTAHKTVILTLLAYGFPVSMSDVNIEGIRGISNTEITYALELGYRIKLLAVIKHSDGQVSIRVQPTLVPKQHMLGSVSGSFNAVLVDGDIVGDTLYYGKGAGSLPTASAVVSDVADVARNLAFNASQRVPASVEHEVYGKLQKLEEVQTGCYLRLTLLDLPGTIAQIASILGKHGISIASMIQKSSCVGEYVPVIMLTHKAPESAYRLALAEIDSLEPVGAPTVRLRIEDFS